MLNWVLFLCWLGVTSTGFATVPSQCFDFARSENQKPLRPIENYIKEGEDHSGSGKFKDGKIWGYARGRVLKPIEEVYRLLLDHSIVKDPKRVDLTVIIEKRKGYSDFHKLRLSTSVLFTTIEWEEVWAYQILKGTRKNPDEFLISYQKASGTDFLKHLCGSIFVSRISKLETDVFLYEQIDAFGKRSEKDTAQSHIGTLNTLRSPPQAQEEN